MTNIKSHSRGNPSKNPSEHLSDHPPAHSPPYTRAHIPVLLEPFLALARPLRGHWIDGTLGAGGYSRALLENGAEAVVAIDCDPHAHEMAREWAASYGERLALYEGNFSAMEAAAGGNLVDGVLLDLGVSSMQIDSPARGFSFQSDGPLDMRMSAKGAGAQELVNASSERELADILFQYGGERAAWRVAKAIVAARPFTRTKPLSDCIMGALPKRRYGEAHPATRSFQALRIAVNDELGELIKGLQAAERILRAGGLLAVISFHSLEDRIVKRFLSPALSNDGANRHHPQKDTIKGAFELITKRAVVASARERAENPRARSARLRIARRNAMPYRSDRCVRRGLGLPGLVAL